MGEKKEKKKEKYIAFITTTDIILLFFMGVLRTQAKWVHFSNVLIRYFCLVFFSFNTRLFNKTCLGFLLVLSPTRNRLPTIASFLSCDSLTPQIRPARLRTASQPFSAAHTNSPLATATTSSSSSARPRRLLVGCL